MTRSMARKLYQQFLLLYPEPFRHEFGDEMLGIFEQCQREQSAWHLLADVVLSVVRQQVRSRFTPVPRSAPLYAEIGSSPHLAWMLSVAAFGTALLASVWVGGSTETPTSGTVVRPEAIYWFPIIPQGRSCYGPPERTGKREVILTTGAWVRGTCEAPEYWTVVRSKNRFWISTVSWGQYCWDEPEPTGRPGGVL